MYVVDLFCYKVFVTMFASSNTKKYDSLKQVIYTLKKKRKNKKTQCLNGLKKEILQLEERFCSKKNDGAPKHDNA